MGPAAPPAPHQQQQGFATYPTRVAQQPQQPPLSHQQQQSREDALAWLRSKCLCRKALTARVDELLSAQQVDTDGRDIPVTSDAVVRYMTCEKGVYSVGILRSLRIEGPREVSMRVDSGASAPTDVLLRTVSSSGFSPSEVPETLLSQLAHRRLGKPTAGGGGAGGAAGGGGGGGGSVDVPLKRTPAASAAPAALAAPPPAASPVRRSVQWCVGREAYSVEAAEDACTAYRGGVRLATFRSAEMERGARGGGGGVLRLPAERMHDVLLPLPESASEAKAKVKELIAMFGAMRVPVAHNLSVPAAASSSSPPPQAQAQAQAQPGSNGGGGAGPAGVVRRRVSAEEADEIERGGMYNRAEHETMPMVYDRPAQAAAAPAAAAPVPPAAVPRLALGPAASTTSSSGGRRLSNATPTLLADALSPRERGLSPRQNAPPQRITEREALNVNLRRFGFVEHVVDADGACQFRSIAWHLFGKVKQHTAVRRRVVEWLQEKRDGYSPFVEEDFDEYLQKMSHPTCWGDHVTLQAAADAYCVLINVVTSHSFSEENTGERRGGWLHVIRPQKNGKDVTPTSDIWVCVALFFFWFFSYYLHLCSHHVSLLNTHNGTQHTQLSYCEESNAEHYNPITRQGKSALPHS